ncbi:protein pygopus-like protein [Leptotrombidium deliense]|uniref:Protein pygopus-like protein n=1 Tax=Leptotrombidium deliense TaxID=299467 RepID=A0A443SQB6_9ACAR|nr:protein pygopus-like protein [Leptotrombidium deliense]
MPRERKTALKTKNSSVDISIEGEAPVIATKSKKRRTSLAAGANGPQSVGGAAVSQGSIDLAPPIPSSTYGDTMIAANPFDDAPTRSTTSQPSTPTQSQTNNPSQVSMSQNPPPQSQQPPSQQNKPVPMLSGKVYPVEQSMVFNPANPNAPPIYPCGICHKEVHDNDQAIFCESGCNFCFHRSCTGLTEYAFHLLASEVYAEWVCDKCLQTKNIPLVKFKP